MYNDGYLIDSLAANILEIFKNHEKWFREQYARVKAETSDTVDAWSYVKAPIEGLSVDDIYVIYCIVAEEEEAKEQG